MGSSGKHKLYTKREITNVLQILWHFCLSNIIINRQLLQSANGSGKDETCANVEQMFTTRNGYSIKQAENLNRLAIEKEFKTPHNYGIRDKYKGY
jgi:hypothetical protein